eukprot:scaffold25055_cov68-Phaeocystis_antarctica.AAC.7
MDGRSECAARARARAARVPRGRAATRESRLRHEARFVLSPPRVAPRKLDTHTMTHLPGSCDGIPSRIHQRRRPAHCNDQVLRLESRSGCEHQRISVRPPHAHFMASTIRFTSTASPVRVTSLRRRWRRHRWSWRRRGDGGEQRQLLRLGPSWADGAHLRISGAATLARRARDPLRSQSSRWASTVASRCSRRGSDAPSLCPEGDVPARRPRTSSPSSRRPSPLGLPRATPTSTSCGHVAGVPWPGPWPRRLQSRALRCPPGWSAVRRPWSQLGLG